MSDLSVPPWVERKCWLVDASWFTVWDATSDLAQATWEWPKRGRGRVAEYEMNGLRNWAADPQSVSP